MRAVGFQAASEPVSRVAMSRSSIVRTDGAAVDRTGHRDDRLLRVAIVINAILPKDKWESVVHAAFSWSDSVGSFFNGNHRPNRFQSWFTHFALALKFDADERIFLLHRVQSGVEFWPFEELRDFGFGLHDVVQLPGQCSRSLTCDTTRIDRHCEPMMALTRAHVWKFVDEQNRLSYGPLVKNCQHLVYDFYNRHEQVWSRSESFESFSERLQKLFQAQGGLQMQLQAS